MASPWIHRRCERSPWRSEPLTRILYGRAARATLARGIDQIAALVAPTLGPAARTVAIESLVGRSPEVLDSGGVIARRTIQLADPFEDMGAMLLRHLLMTVLERTGDGAATTAVLTRALVSGLLRYAEASGNVIELRRGLDCALHIALDALNAQARPFEGAQAIARVANGVVRDASIAHVIGGIFDATGPDGAVVVENGESVATTFEYLEGVRWNEGLVSEVFADPGQPGVRLIEPRILVTDCELQEPEQMLPVLEACATDEARNLFVIAPEIHESVIGWLARNRERDVLSGVAAVRAPYLGDVRSAILADIAVATGASFLHKAAGGLRGVSAADLGGARQAWATRHAFGVVGGRGSRNAIRDRVAVARADAIRAADDHDARTIAQERIGRLLGLGAVIRVGAASDIARDELRARTESAVTAARLALEHGVVPGGGMALVRCATAVRRAGLEGDAAVAATIMADALQAPMRTIVRNSGCAEPECIVAEAGLRGPHMAFDVLRCEWVDAVEGGLLDPLAVVRTALEVSASVARVALTTGALVRRNQVAPPAGR